MANYNVPHLVRRGHVFWFRMALPRSMIRRFGRREIKLSLKTTHPNIARLKARALSSGAVQLIAIIRAMPDLTPIKVQELARRYFQEQLDKTEELALLIPLDGAVDPKFESMSALEDIDSLRTQLATRTFDASVKGIAVQAIASEGLDGSTAKGESFELLCAAILRAQIETYRIYAAKLAGRYDETLPKDPLFAGIQSLAPPPLPEGAAAKPKTISTISERYCEIKQADWVKKTLDENRRVLNLFGELIGGNRPIQSINDDDVRNFRDALLKLPSNYMKKQGGKGQSLKKVLTRPKEMALSRRRPQPSTAPT